PPPPPPVGVLPVVRRLEPDGRGGRRHLGVRGERVGLLPPVAVAAEDPVLVPLAGEHTRYEDLPDPAVAQRPHRPAVVRSPAGEVTRHPDATGARCPDREPDAAVLDAGAEDLPQPLVAPFVDQVQVQLTE